MVMKRVLWISALTVVWIVAARVPSDAQGLGLRAGLSVAPDQFYFGAHAESRPIVDELRFRPNVEAGFGSNLTVVAFNAEMVYPFELSNGTRLYAGAGPALVILSRNRRNPAAGNVTSLQPGFNFLVGVRLPGRTFAELKLGVIDSPEVKIGFGFEFP
jgi:hypothetical protein